MPFKGDRCNFLNGSHFLNSNSNSNSDQPEVEVEFEVILQIPKTHWRLPNPKAQELIKS